MPADRPVATLPMYDWPEVRPATDALWSAIAGQLTARGFDAPAALQRERDPDAVWTDPNLLLSQTCGWPYATRLIDHVRYVATPVYAVSGCEGPLYSSMIVARAEDAGEGVAALARRRVARNAVDSFSGHVVIQEAMRGEGIDPDAATWIETGSHRASMRAVASGAADLAAIDAVCWALAGEHEADAVSRLRILRQTPLRPGLPLITAQARGESDAEAIAAAVAEAIASPGLKPETEALYLSGVVRLSAEDYRAAAAQLRPRGR